MDGTLKQLLEALYETTAAAQRLQAENEQLKQIIAAAEAERKKPTEGNG